MRNLLVICFLILSSSCQQEVNKKSNSVLSKNKLPYFISSDFTPRWFNDSNELNNKHKIPSFSFLNQNGDTITNETYRNKIYVADFFFTSCPGICPKLTKNMRVIQDKYKDDPNVLLLSHTVMPWADSIPVLKTYAEATGVPASKWQFIRASEEKTKLQAATFMTNFRPNEDGSDFYHSSFVALVDTKQQIRGFYNVLVSEEVERLIRDIQILLS